VHADHLDTPRVITNTAGQPVWRWDNQSAFGENAPNDNPLGAGTFTCNLRFPGQYFDRETGLHYNYYRDYEPTLGRYVQSDPIGLAGGLNTYGYASANPIRLIDPLGLEVSLCREPALGWMPVDHQWIKTDTIEAGMGGTRGNVPGNESGDLPYDPVQVTNHRGRSLSSNATCERVENVNEKKVNEQLDIGRRLGKWTASNQCQSFVQQVLTNARTPGATGTWRAGATGAW
jgi:RHS repeat-associated protein